MRIKIISSGSKANCTLISCGSTNLLIDAGPTSSFIASELEKENINSKDINGIIITHTHSDHIKGLKVFIKNRTRRERVLFLFFKIKISRS